MCAKGILGLGGSLTALGDQSARALPGWRTGGCGLQSDVQLRAGRARGEPTLGRPHCPGVASEAVRGASRQLSIQGTWPCRSSSRCSPSWNKAHAWPGTGFLHFLWSISSTAQVRESVPCTSRPAAPPGKCPGLGGQQRPLVWLGLTVTLCFPGHGVAPPLGSAKHPSLTVLGTPSSR